MSYLGFPRLHFCGQFQADPSTVNNDPEHFNTREFLPSYQMPGPGATNGWWNPRGTGAWRFYQCVVERVVYRDGTTCDDPAVDPVVGLPVNGADTRVEGKLVDLDPEQQMVSEIWGFKVLVGGRGLGFGGDFKTAAFADIWTRFPQGNPDSFYGAFYQSLLESVRFQNATGSRFLRELAGTGSTPDRVSIHFNVDGFNDDSTSAQFTFGRVVGTIGEYLPGEPAHFVAARALVVATSNLTNVNTAYARLDGQNVLHLDLGNSLATSSTGGSLLDQGQLYAAALVPVIANPSAAPEIELLGEIDYQKPDWYISTAGVQSIPLSGQAATWAAQCPICVVQSTTGPTGPFTPLLSEGPSGGLFVRADQFVFRLNPGETEKTVFYATQFGKAVPKQSIALGFDPTIMRGQVDQGPLSGPAKVGVPTDALKFPATIVTGPDGTAEVGLRADDPGNPREYIDGQVYGITYGPGTTPPPVGTVGNPSQLLSVLVYSSYAAPTDPDWLCDVRPIFQQYANLYPVMRPMVDLGNYASVVSRLGILDRVFSLPIEDPNYMPVTRDLSRAKHDMIRAWLQRPDYMNLDSVEDLKTALQQAIELEHATIPPYLCALYSIKDGCNTQVASLIRSVVMEEMLHLATAANLLLSIGGSPSIGHPNFVPGYPGSLPGGLRGGLTVRLRRCSISQIRDVFMQIEEPEVTADSVKRQAAPRDPRQTHDYTIGWFYSTILATFEKLVAQGKITLGNAGRQVSQWHGPGTLYVIRTLDDVRKAIREIKEQGEGASPLNPDAADKELAHYYRFAEIVAGREIVITRGGFTFTGAAIPFDPDGVWPMMDDPNYVLFPAGSRGRILSEQFADTYQALLNCLHETFNGNPARLGDAVGLMYSLSVVARTLMQTPSGRNDGTTAGPSFQRSVPGVSS